MISTWEKVKIYVKVFLRQKRNQTYLNWTPSKTISTNYLIFKHFILEITIKMIFYFILKAKNEDYCKNCKIEEY